MTTGQIERYQRGGDLYAELASQYGAAGADSVARAALSGDRGEVSTALGILRRGGNLEESTWNIFWNQIATDPFAAPLESANSGLSTVLGSAVKGIVKNPLVLLAVVAGGLYALHHFKVINLKLR